MMALPDCEVKVRQVSNLWAERRGEDVRDQCSNQFRPFLLVMCGLKNQRDEIAVGCPDLSDGVCVVNVIYSLSPREYDAC